MYFKGCTPPVMVLIDTHQNVRYATHMEHRNYKTRRVLSGGTPSHQYGYYEMRTQESSGKRRSYFKVLVNLDEHQTPEDALQAWPGEVERLRSAGRDKRADWLVGKLERLTNIVGGDGMR